MSHINPMNQIVEFLESTQDVFDEGIEMTRDVKQAYDRILSETERFVKDLKGYNRGTVSRDKVKQAYTALIKEFERYFHYL